MDTPKDPLKDMLHKVEHGTRADGTYHRVKKRTVKPRKPRDPLAPKQGGWKGNPNSIAALAAHRAKTYFGSGPNLRLCQKPGCGQVAVRDVDFCRMHGGQREVQARKKLDPDYKPPRAKFVGRVLYRMVKDAKIPRDLMEQQTFVQVLTVAVGYVQAGEHDTTRQAYARKAAAQAVALAMISAWVNFKDSGDLRAWAVAVEQARRAGLL